VVIVRELDRLTNKELLETYLEQPSPTTCLILHTTKPDFRRKPYVTAKKHATVVKFDPIREYLVAGWITTRVKQQGREIDPEATKILAAYAGTSLREIQNELDKLYIFLGDRGLIVSDDIKAVVGTSKEYNIFELQNAIGTKNPARSTEILNRMLDAGESPILVIVMLTRYFAALWKLYDLRRKGNTGLAHAIGVNPYFVKDYVSALENYSVSELERSFEVLAAADEQLKSTAIDPQQIMLNMVLNLIGQEVVAFG
jgi:DNA polymerase-3 subunit delta